MNKRHVPFKPSRFGDPERFPGALSAGTAAKLLAAVGDVALVLDSDGAILDMAVSERELAAYGLDDWRGAPLGDIVTVESRPKIVEMLRDAAAGTPARWRQVNHPTLNGEVAIRYLMMPLDGDDRLIAIGQDLRAQAAVQQRLLQTQQALERDYLRLRQTETRYRLLFDLAQEPVLIVDAASRRIREANPAAHRLLGAAAESLVGQPASAIVAAGDREALIAQFGAADAADDVAPVQLRLAGGGEARVAARAFRQAREALLLVQLEAVGGDDGAPADSRLDALVEAMPDAFVMVDRQLAVLTANAAFLELAEAASADRVRGQPLATWLGRPGIDLDLMMGQLREHGAVRNVSTILRGRAGGVEEVEVSGVAATDRAEPCYGFTIRAVSRRLRSVPDPGRDLPRSVEQLTELVGRMSLKDIVRESTDLIERLCIEAALTYTSDNRASAAEILGVSRQSLYSKLHRHGLGSLVPGDDND